ncbi:MAG: hypothetical protein JRE47_06465, partial [Deltaproteobacteria bacterium]|nr:hypothetical protein [Deltaproteobacteria bacterium]
DPDNGFPDLSDLAQFVGGDTLKNEVDALGINFDIQEIGILFRLNDKSLSVFIKSKIDFLNLPLEIFTSFPQLYLYGGLDPDMEQDIYAADVLNSNSDLPASTDVPDMWIQELSFKFDTINKTYDLAFEIDDDWYIGLPGNESFALEKIMLDIGYNNGLTCFFSGTFNIAGIEFSISASHPGSQAGWTFEGKTSEGQELPIGELLDELAELFGIDNIPDVIREMYLTDVLISLNTVTKGFHFACKGVFPTHTDDASEDDSTTDNKGLEISVDIRLSTDPSNPGVFRKEFGGQLYIDNYEFALEFETDGSGDSFHASWQGETTEDGTYATLGINDLLKAIGIPSAPIPDEFDMKLISAEFDYYSTGKRFTFIGTTDPNAFLFKDMIFDSKVSTPTDGVPTRGFVFKLDFKDITLEKIPLIGEVLTPDEFRISNVWVMISSQEYKAYDLPSVTGLSTQNVPQTSSGSTTQHGTQLTPGGATQNYTQTYISPGVSFSASFHIGNSYSSNASLPIYNENPAPTSPPVNPSPTVDRKTYSPSGIIFWLNIQKAVGPLHFQKIGVGWKDKKLCLLVNAGFTAAGLTLDLIDFSLGAPPSNLLDISFSLDGMDLDFKEGDIEINGGFLRIIKKDETSYQGEAIMKAGPINLSAIGGYESIDETSPSMYIFAVLDVPLGGPSFFFVTGLSAGFGYNRDLILPNVQNLTRFPLIEAAMGTSNSTNLLGDMQTYIVPCVGQDWVAAGIQFTSFELIKSLALLTVSFGTKLEIALFGTSKVSVPSKLEPDITPIAYAEIVLEAVFSTETESFSISGALTPGAYVLSKKCHLTGGFSLCFWFGKEHSGDFVLIFGGYHPHYKVPAHYPQYVPRIGLSWQLTDDIFIKGGVYFALTPNCIMAGGDLQVTFQMGGIKAWFAGDANFIIYWKPFFYEVGFGVNIGVSYTFNVFGASSTISVSLGVDVDLHGPDFGGSVYVDIYIISFTINFGESHPSHAPIGWNDFKESFLPQYQNTGGNNKQLKATAPSQKVTETKNICLAQVTAGLIKSDNVDYDWVVHPETFILETKSLIPVKDAEFNNEVLENSGEGTSWETTFGIAPMSIGSSLESKHTIEIKDLKTNSVITQDSHGFSFAVEPIIMNSPKSLWSESSPDFSKSGLNNTLKGDSFIKNTLLGIRIKPPCFDPDQTCPAKFKELCYDKYPFSSNLLWNSPDILTADNFDQTQSLDNIGDTINKNDVQNKRNEIISCLKDQCGLLSDDQDCAVDVSNLANIPQDGFIDSPVLSYLGEEVAV